MADTPELAEASEAFERLVIGRYVERLEDWVTRRGALPPEWREATAFGDTLLYLTVEELAALRDQLQALAEPYEARLTRSELRPANSRPVAFLQLALPEEG